MRLGSGVGNNSRPVVPINAPIPSPAKALQILNSARVSSHVAERIDLFHTAGSSSLICAEIANSGQVSMWSNWRTREMTVGTKMPGSINGIEGRFEWMIRNGELVYQNFLPCERINLGMF